MFETFRKYTWSKYTEKTIWYQTFLGFIIGSTGILGIIIMYAPYQGLEPNDRIIALIALMGVVTSIIISLVNQYYQNKQLQTTSMIKIFELLSSPDVRESRETVHKEYCKLKNSHNKITFRNKDDSNIKNDADRVISSFDQVSVLVLNDLVDEELFFDTYGEMIVRDWKTLESEIKIRENNNPRTVRHFTELKNRFLKRIEKENSGRTDDKIYTEPYCEKEYVLKKGALPKGF